MSNVETNEKTTEKVLVFNMGGFVLKLIFAIGFLVWMGPEFKSGGFMDIINSILYGFINNLIIFDGILFVVFGILLVLFISLFSKVEALLAGLGGFGELLINIIFIVILVWPIISDIRKALLYVKNAV